MNLYEQVVALAQQYLPQSEDANHIVNRQCRSHLQIDPNALSAADIPGLARWVGISAGLLIPKEEALSLRQKIEALATKKS
jgi:hypothetical protein